MEFVCIEAKAFMEMNEALEAVEKKMRETCGGGICSMDDWIDNQEACMLMNVSPRKLLQLRRSRIIPYSHIDRKVYYRRQDIIRYLENSIHHVTPRILMTQFILTKESPEIIRFFRNISTLSKMLDDQEKSLRPVLNGERYITDSELAEKLKLTRRTLADYRMNGRLPYYKVGGKLLYKEKDILVLLEKNRVETFDHW